MDTKTILSNKPAILLRRYKKALFEAGYSLDKVILFGSYAKGSPRYASDLDVCVVSKAFTGDIFDVDLKLTKIAHEIDDMIEPHAMTPEDLKDPYSTIATEIREHGVVV